MILIIIRQDDLTEELLRVEGDLVEEYITNVTWRGEICLHVGHHVHLHVGRHVSHHVIGQISY